MVLRLDPTIPMVWRDPTTVQFGVDPAMLVVPEVTAGLERLLALLAAGISESGYAMFAGTFGVPLEVADRLRETLAPCLLAAEDAPRTARALVLGDGPTARGIARVLDEARLRTHEASAAALVVLVADHIVRPADHRRWLQHDLAHLPVVVGEQAITIGPLVEPGASACLHCLALHRRDADAAWPAIASQLATKPPAVHDPLRSEAAVALAARLIADRLGGRDVAVGEEVRIAGDGSEITTRSVAPHPECRCSARPESDWVRAADRATPRPTTRGAASAAHA